MPGKTGKLAMPLVGERMWKCYYAAQVGYSYQVAGHRYSGSLASRCANEDAGRKFVEGLKDKPVVVQRAVRPQRCSLKAVSMS